MRIALGHLVDVRLVGGGTTAGTTVRSFTMRRIE
jgi:hypothetical protein